MAAATPSALRVRLLDATAGGGERGEQEEEERVGGRVEREVEEAVDEHARAARERAERDAPPEAVVRLDAPHALAEEDDEEGEAEQGPDDPGVGEDLQVVVVRLLEAVRAARRVVARVDGAERAEARAQDGVVFDDPDRALPEVRAPRRRVVGVG